MAKERLEEARFGLQGPRDLLEKLQLDYHRFQPEESKGRKHVVFIVFDCAVTAWSLLDWVYHAIPVELRRKYGITTTDDQKALRQFEDYLIKEKGMSWLAICHDLATGAKHFHVDSARKEGLTTDVTGIGRSSRIHESDSERKVSFWPIIHFDDDSEFADEFFANVWLRWQLFLDEEKIDVR